MSHNQNSVDYIQLLEQNPWMRSAFMMGGAGAIYHGLRRCTVLTSALQECIDDAKAERLDPEEECVASHSATKQYDELLDCMETCPNEEVAKRVCAPQTDRLAQEMQRLSRGPAPTADERRAVDKARQCLHSTHNDESRLLCLLNSAESERSQFERCMDKGGIERCKVQAETLFGRMGRILRIASEE